MIGSPDTDDVWAEPIPGRVYGCSYPDVGDVVECVISRTLQGTSIATVFKIVSAVDQLGDLARDG